MARAHIQIQIYTPPAVSALDNVFFFFFLDFFFFFNLVQKKKKN